MDHPSVLPLFGASSARGDPPWFFATGIEYLHSRDIMHGDLKVCTPGRNCFPGLKICYAGRSALEGTGNTRWTGPRPSICCCRRLCIRNRVCRDPGTRSSSVVNARGRGCTWTRKSYVLRVHLHELCSHKSLETEDKYPVIPMITKY